MYGLRLMPKNFGLVRRLLNEVSFGQVMHQVRRNLTTNMFQERETPTIIPNAIYIDPTYNCNRRCIGCYVNPRSGTIDEGLAEQVCEFALRRGVNYIAWLGGEPFLPKVRDIVLGVTANNPKMSFNFCTNGDFIDETLADQIASLDNLVPFVSIDGLQANHDWRRGTGSYEQAMRVFDMLRDRNRLMGYMTTIMPHNHQEVSSEQFVEQMIRKGCMIGGYSFFICCSGKIEDIVDLSDFSITVKKLIQIAQEMPIYILSTDFGYLGNGIQMQGSKRLIAVTVGPSGEVKTERGSIPLGRINEENSLEDIVLSKQVQDIFRKKLLGLGGGERDARLKLVQSITP